MSGSDLTKLAAWAAFSVQIIGYFPLSSKTISGSKSKTYRFTWRGSILPYFSALLTAASFSWCLVYFLRRKDFHSLIQFKSATEVAAYNILIITSTLAGLYIRILALATGKHYQQFWDHTQALLNNFLAETTRFRKIGTSCRLEFFFMFFPFLGHMIYFYVLPLVYSFLDDWSTDISSWTQTDTQLIIGKGFSTFFALLHIGNGIWMNFFVKIYTECLESISVDLKTPKKSSDRHHHHHRKNLKDEKLSNLYHIHPHHQKEGNHHSGGQPYDLKASLEKLTLVDYEIKRFNDFFGNSLLLQVANCVMNLLAYSFFACLWLGRGNWASLWETLIPLFLYGKELLDMGSKAEKLSAASENVLNSLTEDVEFGSLTEEMFLKVQLVTVHLCTKPPVVSARQFFTINRSLVTSVMSALATFLVVLVQFRDQDDQDDKVPLPLTTRTPSVSIVTTTP